MLPDNSPSHCKSNFVNIIWEIGYSYNIQLIIMKIIVLTNLFILKKKNNNFLKD